MSRNAFLILNLGKTTKTGIVETAEIPSIPTTISIVVDAERKLKCRRSK